MKNLKNLKLLKTMMIMNDSARNSNHYDVFILNNDKTTIIHWRDNRSDDDLERIYENRNHVAVYPMDISRRRFIANIILENYELQHNLISPSFGEQIFPRIVTYDETNQSWRMEAIAHNENDLFYNEKTVIKATDFLKSRLDAGNHIIGNKRCNFIIRHIFKQLIYKTYDISTFISKEDF